MPKFSDKTIEAIKNRITISELMQEYAFVENRGGSKWVKCPFHGGGNERTASCKLDDSKGTFYCFGCHESGDIFSLLMKKEGLDFSTSVESLAKKAGVELEVDNSLNNDEAKKIREDKETLYDLYDRLSGTFHYLLLNSDEAKSAREYLDKRKVSSEMIETFKLGYAPQDPNWLYKFLLKKNYSKVFLSISGLFSQKNQTWPLFVNRIMFPIRDRMGRSIAFSGRDLSFSDKTPKYINSPDTLIYHKKENFFGLFEAKNTISSGNLDPILCEGNFDVISMHQAGLKSAIASLGTSFTPEQCSNIKKWYPSIKSINLLFDSDEAGQKSTERAILIINSNSLEQKIHHLESGKDPSEVLEKKGSDGLKEEFETYVTGFDYLVQRNLNRYNIRNARGKSEFIDSFSAFLKGCSSEVERDSYILSLSSIVGLSEEAIKEDLNNRSQTGVSLVPNVTDKVDINPVKDKKNISFDLYAMLYLANHRELFKSYRTRISFGDLTDVLAQKLYMALENAMRDDIVSNELFLTYIGDEELKNDVAVSFALDEYKSGSVDALDEAIDRITLQSYERKRNVINKQLTLIDSTNEDEINDLFGKKLTLDGKILKLRNLLSSYNLKGSEE